MSFWAGDGSNRHEDDLLDEAYANDGTVTLLHLLHHCEAVIADNINAFGSNVCHPVQALCDLIRETAFTHPDVIDLANAEVPVKIRS